MMNITLMNTTFTVFIYLENIEKLTDKLVLRKFFLNEKDAKKYYCNLKKSIIKKGYIYSFSNEIHYIYAGSTTMYAAYYDSEMENDLTLMLERQSCNIDIDEKHDKVTLYDDSWDGGKIHIFEGIEKGMKSIFEDGELTFDHFTDSNKELGALINK